MRRPCKLTTSEPGKGQLPTTTTTERHTPEANAALTPAKKARATATLGKKSIHTYIAQATSGPSLQPAKTGSCVYPQASIVLHFVTKVGPS